MNSWFWRSVTFLVLVAGCSNDNPTGGGNLPPRIVSLNASPSSVVLGGESRVTALVSDPDNDPLHISWEATGGVFDDSTRTSTSWHGPTAPGLYILYLTVSDGSASATDSVDIAVGNATLTVMSAPGHAFITLDGTATGRTTPHTFDPVPVGFHVVSLFSPYYRYQTKPGIELVHGQSDTLRFILPPVADEYLDLGRNDILELGGIAFLPSGLGVVYVAKTATEIAVFSDPLFPTASTPRGVRVLGPVRFEEPISIGSEGPNLFFVNTNDSLMVVPIRDRNSDGTVDSVGTADGLLRQKYAPAISTTNLLAFSYTPSEDPASVFLSYAQYSDEGLGTVLTGTKTLGKLPSWKPGEPWLAYQFNDAIMYSVVSPFTAPGGDTLYAGGLNTAPSWGKWGAKTVAFLHGNVPGNYTDLMLTAYNAPESITILRNLDDPRFIAWSPLEEILAFTEHPGGTPRIRIVSQLPLP